MRDGLKLTHIIIFFFNKKLRIFSNHYQKVFRVRFNLHISEDQEYVFCEILQNIVRSTIKSTIQISFLSRPIELQTHFMLWDEYFYNFIRTHLLASPCGPRFEKAPLSLLIDLRSVWDSVERTERTILIYEILFNCHGRGGGNASPYTWHSDAFAPPPSSHKFSVKIYKNNRDRVKYLMSLFRIFVDCVYVKYWRVSVQSHSF